MMVRQYSGIVLLLLFVAGCEWPFDTKPTIDGPLFSITAELGAAYFIDSTFVVLTWNQVTVDDFVSWKISRRYLHPKDTLSNEWILRAIITDQATITWQDTIYDDEDIQYQVMLFKHEGPYGFSEVTLSVPEVTRLDVPTDFSYVNEAVASPIIDDGDTVLVHPGLYETWPIDFTDRAIYLLSTEGAAQTILWPPPSDSGDWPRKPLVTMAGGLLQGFTIIDGNAIWGGGLYAANSSIIRQCVFRENIAVSGHTASSKGGGLYLTGSTRLENCIILNNFSASLGGGIYAGEAIRVGTPPDNVRIVNCTILGNMSGLRGGGITCSGGIVTIENSIVRYNVAFSSQDMNDISPRPDQLGAPTVVYSNSDSAWILADSTNIASDPRFVYLSLFEARPRPDVHLLPDSPCINAGNPDPAYNDPDGSRNDMGAFGGPHGDWEGLGEVPEVRE